MKTFKVEIENEIKVHYYMKEVWVNQVNSMPVIVSKSLLDLFPARIHSSEHDETGQTVKYDQIKNWFEYAGEL